MKNALTAMNKTISCSETDSFIYNEQVFNEDGTPRKDTKVGRTDDICSRYKGKSTELASQKYHMHPSEITFVPDNIKRRYSRNDLDPPPREDQPITYCMYAEKYIHEYLEKKGAKRIINPSSKRRTESFINYSEWKDMTQEDIRNHICEILTKNGFKVSKNHKPIKDADDLQYYKPKQTKKKKKKKKKNLAQLI